MKMRLARLNAKRKRHPPSAKIAQRILLEQIDAAVKLAPFSVLVSAGVLAVEVTASWQAGFHEFSAILFIFLGTQLGLILWGCLRWSHTANRRHDARRVAMVAVAAAALAGLTWAIMPIVLFPSAGPDLRLMIACTMAGLVCTGLVLAPLAVAARAFIVPVIAGSALALYLADDRFYIFVGFLLAIYATFIISSIGYISRLFTRTISAQLQIENQSDMIPLLLWNYDQSASDWFWETDAHVLLRNVSSRFAQAVGRDETEIEGKGFAEVISLNAIAGVAGPPRGEGYSQLAHCFAEQLQFRDLVVSVQRRADRRWWSLTARPFYDENGAFEGYRGIGSDITDARIAEDRIAHQARHDALTGLPNRASFFDALASACEGAASNPFALLNLDLDGFKKVNDTFGHPAGDELLRMISRRLRGALRDTDTVARMGGDEFAVLQVKASVASATALAERVIETLSAPYRVIGETVSIGVSIGIALAPSSGTRVEEIIGNADVAMYEAKRAEKGSYRVFNASVGSELGARRLLLSDLREMIASDQLWLAFQPMLDTETAALRGFEALLRWQHPVHGLVLPDQFIPLAEEAGILGDIGAWVLRQACREATSWNDGLRVAVNVSATQMQERGLFKLVSEILAETGLAANRLELELTESIFMEASPTTIGTMRQLQELGIRLALDDFGIGFSSLCHLRGFAFDKIKIDRSFVRDVDHDRRSAGIVHAVIGLAATLGIATTAEGVETNEQWNSLRAQGCTEVQGYLFSQPLPADELMAYILARDTLAPSTAAKPLAVDMPPRTHETIMLTEFL